MAKFSARQVEYLSALASTAKSLAKRGSKLLKKTPMPHDGLLTSTTPPHGWNPEPLTMGKETVKRLKIGWDQFGGIRKAHYVPVIDNAKNQVGYATVTTRRGTARVTNWKHFSDTMGSSSNPMGAREALRLEKTFSKAHPDIHTFKFERVYEPGTHQNFKTGMFKWHGLNMVRRKVPVAGRGPLRAAARKQDTRDIATAGVARWVLVPVLVRSPTRNGSKGMAELSLLEDLRVKLCAATTVMGKVRRKLSWVFVDLAPLDWVPLDRVDPVRLAEEKELLVFERMTAEQLERLQAQVCEAMGMMAGVTEILSLIAEALLLMTPEDAARLRLSTSKGMALAAEAKDLDTEIELRRKWPRSAERMGEVQGAAQIRWDKQGTCGTPGCIDSGCSCSLCGKPIGISEDDPRWGDHDFNCGDCDLCRDQVPIILFQGGWVSKTTLQASFHTRCFESITFEALMDDS